MTLTERYLNAVAAQLPKDEREDIIAELAEEIAARRESREDEPGRALTEDEEEALLREIGHPLTVAARYGKGPHHVVGPELFPWWMFGVKAGLIVMAAIVALGAVVRVVVGDVEVGRAIGQGFHSLFNGAIMLVGFATIAGFIFERQKDRPAFMREWRVKDLGVFEFGGGLDADRVSRGLQQGDWSGAKAFGVTSKSSPVVRGLASAIGVGVVLLWWIGWLPLTHTTPETFGAIIGDVDYGRILRELHTLLYWPVIAVLLVRIAFDLTRAAYPEGVRFTAMGDIGFGLAEAALGVWLWTASPLSPVIYEPTVADVVDRVRNMFGAGWWSVADIVMLIVLFGFISAVFRVLQAIGRVITGKA